MTSVEELLNCPVCLRRYEDPRQLACQHVFCLRPCLEGLLEFKHAMRVRCPVCRAEERLPSGGVVSLPKSFTISHLLDLSFQNTSTTDSEVKTCSLCKMSSSSLEICQHCGKEACSACRSGHLRQLRAELMHSLSELRRKAPKLLQIVSEREKNAANLDREASVLRLSVEREWARLEAALARRRSILLEHVDQYREKQRQKVYRQVELLNVESAAVNSFCGSAEECCRSSEEDSEQLKAMCHQATDYIRVLSDVAKENEEFKFELTLHVDVVEFSRCLDLMCVWKETNSTRQIPSTHIPTTAQQVNNSSLQIPQNTQLTVNQNIPLPPLQASQRTPPPSFHPPPPQAIQNGETSPRENFSQDVLSFENPSFRRRRRNLGTPFRQRRLSTRAQQTTSISAPNDVVDVHASHATAGSTMERVFPPPEMAQRSRTFVVQRDEDEVNGKSLYNCLPYIEKQKPISLLGGKGSARGQFNYPRGLAMSDDGQRLFVADSSNHRIQVFQAGDCCAVYSDYDTPGCEMECLSGLAIESSGNLRLAAADRYNHRVLIFDSNSGRYLSQLQPAQEQCFSYPWGLAWSMKGLLWVCDKNNHRILGFDLRRGRDGGFVRQIGGRNELDSPQYLIVAADNFGGQLIISDTNHHRISVYSQDGGSPIKHIGSEGCGLSQFRHPRGLAMDVCGRLLVADSGNSRVSVWNLNSRPSSAGGVPLCTFGAGAGCGPGQFRGLEGLALDNLTNVYLSDRDNHRVQIF